MVNSAPASGHNTLIPFKLLLLLYSLGRSKGGIDLKHTTKYKREWRVAHPCASSWIYIWNMGYDKYVILCVSSLSYCMHMGINCGHFLKFYIQIWDTENVKWPKMIITYVHATQKVNYNDIPKIPVDSFICVNTGGEGTRHQVTRLLGNAFGAPKKQLFSSPNFGDGFLGQQTSRSRPRRAPPQENKKCPDEGGKSKGQDKWQEEAVFYFFHLGCGSSTILQEVWTHHGWSFPLSFRTHEFYSGWWF